MSVTLTEYGDFECPYCRRASPAVKQVRAQFGDRLDFAWRHFPIAHKHPHAELAAQAAEAARAQGRFEEMHDALFAHQDALELSDLVGYAREIGLDAKRFERELREGVYAERVRSEHEEGERRGVSSTPTFFLDGERYDGFYDAESLSWAIEDALAGRR